MNSFFCALATDQLYRHCICAFNGTLKQTLINVADLLYIERTVRQGTPLILLDCLQQEQHRAVVDRQGPSIVRAPA
ncbi:hypothetical protein D3C81_1153780 [compost metagenome]